jgi:NADPH:quinone reductase-like Zn-dependent oxidoreductase
MKAIQITGFGAPENVLQLAILPEPTITNSDEVIVQMKYSPVNHSDLMIIQGMFPLQLSFPAVVGGEGVGKVLSVGKEVTNVKPGDNVLVPFGFGAWTERLKIASEKLYVLSPEIDLKQASMLLVNPPTAVLLLNEFVSLAKDSWVVYNAANSSIARSIVAIAKSRGLKTLGIVRNQKAVEAALASGADKILVDSDTIFEDAKLATGDANIQLALDAVGGEATNTLVKISGVDSHIVVYAFESGQPSVIDQGALIGKRMTVHGFNMFYPQFLPKLKAATDESAKLLQSEALIVPITGVYPISSFKDAIAHTVRGGKILFEMNNQVIV